MNLLIHWPQLVHHVLLIVQLVSLTVQAKLNANHVLKISWWNNRHAERFAIHQLCMIGVLERAPFAPMENGWIRQQRAANFVTLDVIFANLILWIRSSQSALIAIQLLFKIKANAENNVLTISSTIGTYLIAWIALTLALSALILPLSAWLAKRFSIFKPQMECALQNVTHQ